MLDDSARPVVRLATEVDAAALAAMRRAWSEEDAGHPIHDPAFEADFARWWARDPHRLTWVGVLDGAVTGTVSLETSERPPEPGPESSWRAPRRWGWVTNAYVAPSARGGGLGRALLDAAIAHADAHGFARVVLHPTDGSVAFYGRAGFVPATDLLRRSLGGTAPRP